MLGIQIVDLALCELFFFFFYTGYYHHFVIVTMIYSFGQVMLGATNPSRWNRTKYGNMQNTNLGNTIAGQYLDVNQA